MQGLWKDNKYNFARDKRRAFSRARSDSEGAEAKAVKVKEHTFETRFYNTYCFPIESYQEIVKFYGLIIGS